MRFVVSCAGLAILAGCTANVGEQLPDDPDSLMVFSINGPAFSSQEGELTPEQEKGELLGGFPVLGKVEVSDSTKRRAIVSSVKAAIREPNVLPAKCFIPRHGIRVTKGETTYDLVLCFQCNNYQGYRNDSKAPKLLPVSASAQAQLDDLLRAANVPLAPK